MLPAVFLDKDGTLIPDVPYNVNPELIELSSGAAEGLRLLHAVGYPLIVVSNQSGIARGYFPETALVPVVQKLRALFDEVGVPLTGFYYCPHYPNGEVAEYAIACSCRKPEPGLLLQATNEQKIDLSRSWMIGDILNDVEAGRRAGCRTILIDNGNETEWLLSPLREPHYRAKDLTEAAHIICQEVVSQGAGEQGSRRAGEQGSEGNSVSLPHLSSLAPPHLSSLTTPSHPHS